MIKLVVLDLDGTVVQESLTISDRVLATLKAVNEQGVKVVVATGRMFPSTIPFARKIGTQNPVISYQGAMIRDIAEPLDNILAHPILFHQTIDQALAKQIIDWVQAEGWHTNLYVNDNLFTSMHNPASKYYQNISGVVPQQVPDLHVGLTDHPSKLMIIDDRCDEIVAELKRNFPVGLSILKSRSNFCEIVHESVSKWNALSHLLDKWQIQPDEVMAIGDQENDLSMITAAGVGVAMGNAPDNVKALANYVTAPISEDGAALAIEKFVLGHLPLADVRP